MAVTIPQDVAEKIRVIYEHISECFWPTYNPFENKLIIRLPFQCIDYINVDDSGVEISGGNGEDYEIIYDRLLKKALFKFSDDDVEINDITNFKLGIYPADNDQAVYIGIELGAEEGHSNQ